MEPYILNQSVVFFDYFNFVSAHKSIWIAVGRNFRFHILVILQENAFQYSRVT